MIKEYFLDLHGIGGIDELHERIKDCLGFPEYYGKNADAFWDCITSDIAVPTRIVVSGICELDGYSRLAWSFIRSCLDEAVQWYADTGHELKIIYRN